MSADRPGRPNFPLSASGSGRPDFPLSASRPGRSGGTNISLSAGRPGRSDLSLSTGRPGRSGFSLFPGCSHWSDSAFRSRLAPASFFSLCSLWPCNTLNPLFAGGSLFTDRSPLAHITHIAFWTGRSLQPHVSFGADRAAVPFRSNWSRISPDTLSPWISRIAFWTCIAPNSLKASWPGGTSHSSGANRTRASRISFRSLRPGYAPLSSGALRPDRTRRTFIAYNISVVTIACVTCVSTIISSVNGIISASVHCHIPPD